MPRSRCFQGGPATESAMRHSPGVIRRFRRSALLNIDPGLLQMWVSTGSVIVAPHDLYFTIEESTGHPNTRVPDLGLVGHQTRPCVALDWWSCQPPAPEAPFTSI